MGITNPNRFREEDLRPGDAPQSAGTVLASGEEINAQNARLAAHQSELQTAGKAGGKEKSQRQPGGGQPPIAAPTRMGIGPGGAAMGFDQALAMLEAPGNIGDVKTALAAGQAGSEKQLSEFTQQAGAPIEYGAMEQETMGRALLPFAEGQQAQQREAYNEARKLVHRSYEGPRSMGEKEEGEMGRSPYEKTRAIASDAQIAAEAMGTGRGRAALLRQSGGLNPGQAAAEAARLHGQPGYTKGVREVAGQAGEAFAGLEKSKLETTVTGLERDVQAGQAGHEAMLDVGGRQKAIVEAATKRADDKGERIIKAQESFAEFMNNGDPEALGGLVNTTVLDGRFSQDAARKEWESIWTAPAYRAIVDHPPLQLATHYLGKQVLIPSEISVERWRNDPRYDTISSNLWENMRGMTNRDHRSPGRWLLWTQKTAWRVNTAIQNGQEPSRHAVQALNLLNETRAIFERQHRLERSFSPKLPRLMPGHTGGSDWGYRSAASLVPINPDSVANSGRGGYFSGEMRPQTGIRGEHAGAVPLYLGVPGMALPFLDLRSEDEQGKPFVSAPQGVPTPITEMTNLENQKYNILENLAGGNSPFGSGKPVDDEMKIHLNSIIGGEVELARQRGEGLTHAEAAWRIVRKAHQDSFSEVYEQADNNFWDWAWRIISAAAVAAVTAFYTTGNLWVTIIAAIVGGLSGGFGYNEMTGHSEDYKVRPTPAAGGVSEVPDDEYWEALQANQHYEEGQTPEARERAEQELAGLGIQ